MIQRGFVPSLDIAAQTMDALPLAEIDVPECKTVKVGSATIQLCVNPDLPPGVLVCGNVVLTGIGTGKFDSLI